MRALAAPLILLLSPPAFAEEPPPEAGAPSAGEAPGAPEALEVAVPVTEPAPPPAPDPRLQAEIDRLQAELAALAERLDEQEAAASEQGKDLAKTKLAMIPKDAIRFDLEGYYRMRSHITHGLLSAQTGEDGAYRGDLKYMTHRLKLRPLLNYKDLAKFAMEIDAFGDPQFGMSEAVWGDNAQLQDTPLFASDPSFTNTRGFEGSGGPKLTRAWVEATLPVGLLRVGRQPSQWGMGLLANGGDGFDDAFGENRYGATYDRVMFATRPIAIASKIAGKPDAGIPLFAAIGVDRLVESPLHEYYGYKCTPGKVYGDRGFDERCDTDGDGVTDLDHPYVDDERDADDRSSSWLADPSDDVMEVVYVLIYRGEDVEYLGGKGPLHVGSYVVNRTQKESGSNVWIADAYVKARVQGVSVEFEGLTIQGKSSAIALPGAIDPSADDPLAKQVAIWGYVGRVGYERPAFKVQVEHGYASGDDNPADDHFTGRALAPDHNVGLLLYEEVLSRVTAALWTESAFGLWSQGGVYNSRYVFPTAHWYPMENWELLVGGVMAWPDKPDGAFVLCRPDEGCAESRATASMLGWEVDVGVKHRWHEHLMFALEGGFAKATDRLPLALAGLDPDGSYFTIQSRFAYEF